LPACLRPTRWVMRRTEEGARLSAASLLPVPEGWHSRRRQGELARLAILATTYSQLAPDQVEVGKVDSLPVRFAGWRRSPMLSAAKWHLLSRRSSTRPSSRQARLSPWLPRSSRCSDVPTQAEPYRPACWSWKAGRTLSTTATSAKAENRRGGLRQIAGDCGRAEFDRV
jgi:hypothetical protein